MSYIQSLYHIVFRTYCGEHTINIENERELYAVILKQSESLSVKLLRIGGMPDHLHLFVSLPATMSVSQYVQNVKAFSSKWLKDSPLFPKWRGWGREYAAISYSVKEKDVVINYIRNQKEHHKKHSFSEEYRSFLEENGVAIREEYFLKD